MDRTSGYVVKMMPFLPVLLRESGSMTAPDRMWLPTVAALNSYVHLCAGDIVFPVQTSILTLSRCCLTTENECTIN